MTAQQAVQAIRALVTNSAGRKAIWVDELLRILDQCDNPGVEETWNAVTYVGG